MPESFEFEHYQLLKNPDGSFTELGRGAMGITYKAFDTSLRCNVALKVISGSLLEDEKVAERFLREARSAASRQPSLDSRPPRRRSGVSLQWSFRRSIAK